jgi:uncharacterized protein YbjT (DUF2867 family)
MTNRDDLILVIGGTGKTGRRIVRRLRDRGTGVRVGSRLGDPPFDWNEPSTWPGVLAGATAVYIAYHPDLAFPGAAGHIRAFVAAATDAGATRVVLLSGRGEEGALASEDAAKAGAAEWTIVRSAWFAQNFSEHFLLQPVMAGEIALPAGDVAEPFVDADDVADVAVAALTQPGHAGHTYELTGPHLLTFADAADTITRAVGRPVTYVAVTPEDYADAARRAGVPEEEVGTLTDLFTRVLDGRNAHITHDVERVLHAPARSFADYAIATAGTDAWHRSASAGVGR